MSRRGPYKSYYDSGNNVEVPRSTHYKKKNVNNEGKLIFQYQKTKLDELCQPSDLHKLHVSNNSSC